MYTNTLTGILNVRWQYAEVSHCQVGQKSCSLLNDNGSKHVETARNL
jgi:hypothetical protein